MSRGAYGIREIWLNNSYHYENKSLDILSQDMLGINFTNIALCRCIMPHLSFADLLIQLKLLTEISTQH